MANQALQSNHAPTTPFSAPWLGRLRNALCTENGKPFLAKGVTVTSAQLTAISSASEIARRRMIPASDQEIIAEMAILLAAFPSQDQGASPADLRVEGYISALYGKPLWAIKEARQRILKGETVLDRRWAPTPPQIAALVFSICDPIRRDLRDLEDIQIAAGGRDPLKLSDPDERAAFVAELIDKNGLRRIHDEDDAKAKARLNEQLRKANDALFERDCKAAGVDPARGVSPALLRTLGQLPNAIHKP